MSKHRAWCFTIANYTSSDWFAVRHVFTKVKYGVCGEEICPKTKTPHLQGYAHFHNALSMKAVSKMLTRANLRVADGDDTHNQIYCSKDNTNVLEVGEVSVGQGSRTDIKQVAQLIKNGEVSITDVMFDFPEIYVKYSRALEKMFLATMKSRDNPPEVHWLWGLAGTGKSRFVWDTYGKENVFTKDGTMWWDGYNQDKVILIDDFDNMIPYRTLLRILDRYPYQGQVKGAYVQINSPLIYITAEHPPTYFWNDNELAQVQRRLTSVLEIK